MSGSIMGKFLGILGWEEIDDEYEENESMSSPQHNKVVPLPSQRSTEIVVLRLSSFGEARNATSHLKSRKSIILNLEDVPKEESKRVIDFICGTAYALNGNMQRIAEELFLFTPHNVTVIVEEGKQAQDS